MAEVDTKEQILRVISAASLVASFGSMVLAVQPAITLGDYQELKSLVIILINAFFDFFLSIISWVTAKETSYCTALGFFLELSELGSVVMSGAVAICLYSLGTTSINGDRPSITKFDRAENWIIYHYKIFTSAIGILLLVTLFVPLVRKDYGPSDAQWCWIKGDNDIEKIIILYTWVWSVILVMMFLVIRWRIISVPALNEDDSANFWKQLLYYCCAFVLVWIFPTAHRVTGALGISTHPWIVYLHYISSSLKGTLNFLVILTVFVYNKIVYSNRDDYSTID